MNTGDPTLDASMHINRLDSIKTPIELQTCDVCGNDEEDFRISPDGLGFVCCDCLKNVSAVTEHYMNEAGKTKEEMELYFENLKIIK